MGKSRRSRALASRTNPILKPVKPPTDPELQKLREAKILPILHDLRDADPKRRTAAASAVANLAQDTRCRKLLLREQVVPIVLTETLTDMSIESRSAGWEILRQLVITEEDDFCVHLFRLDVLTAAEHASAMVTEAITSRDQSFQRLTKAHQQFVWQIACSLVCVLGALGKAKEEIFKAIAANAVVARLVFVLATNELTSADLLDLTLSCLLILATESLKLASADLQLLIERLRGLTSEHQPQAVLACGILHRIFAGLRRKDQSLGEEGVTDAFLVSELSRILGRFLSGQQPASDDTTAHRAGDLQLALGLLESIAACQQEFPETDGTDEPEWHGIDNDEEMNGHQDADEEPPGGGDDEDMDDVAGIDTVMEEDQIEDGASVIPYSPTLGNLVREAVPHLLKLVTVSGVGTEHADMLKGALSTLGTIAWTFTTVDGLGNQIPTTTTTTTTTEAVSIWDPCAMKIWEEAVTPILKMDTADLEAAGLVGNLAWALASSLQGKTPLANDGYRRFMTLYQATQAISSEAHSSSEKTLDEDAFDTIGVKCIGVLGQLARPPATLSVNREVGIFLITILESLPQTPVTDALQALNEIFDIYGDEDLECDEIFWRDGFFGHLEAIQPRFTAMVRAIDKKKAPELRMKADEALLNLTRFLRYKQKHRPDVDDTV